MLHKFMDIELELAPGVLIPRQETELLGQAALDAIIDLPRPVVIDMCCGSGNLAMAISSARPDARVFASDLTGETVALARVNADRLGLSVTVVQGDMFSALRGRGLEESVDLVVCNPPYISTAKLDGESAYLLENEPREAFDAGPYGIGIQQKLIVEALAFLRVNGWLAFEFGAGQDRQVKALLNRSRGYGAPEFIADADGIARVVVVQRA